MNRLRELHLHGFKSFADPTRFVFEPGVNAVIGPNGSGKSNMADAVRWVLGEQSNRSLRTRRADDVIFAGSEQRRPQGMAEAVLTLDNADGWLPIDFAEVTIGRRAYRTGESEYLINGARARLRDVVGLLGEGRLGANELVVVGQGTVDAALSLRPDERRQLFEEAAGVKNLQVRKNEALSRLARSAENLSRVSDLVGELKPQVRRLAAQAQHQQEHDQLGSRARALVAESHRRREAAARSALGETRRVAAAAEAALEEQRAAAATRRDAVAVAEDRYWEAETAARRAVEARSAIREELIRAQARLDSVAARHRDHEASLSDGEAQLVEARAALARIDADARPGALDPRIADAARAEQAWKAAVAALSSADGELLAAEEALAALRRDESELIAALGRRAEEEARANARHEQMRGELHSARAILGEARATAEAGDRALNDASAEVDAAGTALDAAARGRDEAQIAADDARQAAAGLRERAAALRAELDAQVERAEHGGRLGTLLAAAGWPTLLDNLDAPHEAWPAIEALVGGELDHALLWRDGDLSGPLRDARGSVRLLDVSDRAGSDRDAALAAVGGTQTLAEWVGGGSMPAAFHRTAVARDVEALVDGRALIPTGWSAVTADGDLADGRGVLVLRGRGDPPGGAAALEHARRRELAELLEQVKRDGDDAQGVAHAAAERLRAARDRHLAARDGLDATERALRRAREDADAAQAAMVRAQRSEGEIEAELAVAAPSASPAPEPSAPPESLARDLNAREERAVAARHRRAGAAAARDAAREDWKRARAVAEALEARHGSERIDRPALEARRAQLDLELAARREAAAASAAEHEAAVQAADAARVAEASASQTSEAADAQRELRRAELLELERTDAGGAHLSELERAAQAAAIEASRREDALVALAREHEIALESLPEETGGSADPEAEPSDQLVAELTPMDDETIETELRRVRRTLAQIGSVNPFAVDEHRELAARLEELTAQDDDLRGAIAATEELIARLDAEIGARFDAAFTAIGDRFDEYCRLLFDGGSASLSIGDEEDGEAPGGIEIVVRPPGKRLQRLAMLSGGERALTGVALLFAMLTVNPVPFCILDEVDAALDEANIGRFATALRKLAESIDFVVITHNRATIEVADTIYGVTMTDAAVSRVLSLRLADVAAEVTA